LYVTKYGFLLSTKQCNVDWNHWNHKTRFASHGRHKQKPFEEYKKTIFDSNVCTRTTHNILHWSHWNHKICLTRVSWAKVFDHRKKPIFYSNTCKGTTKYFTLTSLKPQDFTHTGIMHEQKKGFQSIREKTIFYL
jgi:hypothetical protein